ncbi:MAG: hypothetical protein JNM17_29425 [Archangium sp.]|nr:hypothetical protein [Archangium sp.]
MRSLWPGLVLLVAFSSCGNEETPLARQQQALVSVTPIPTLNTVDASVGDFAPRDFFALGGQVFFVANALGNGEELWVTDGTTAGTRLVRDLHPGPSGSTPFAMTSLGGRAFFVANEASTGFNVWVSNGTFAGTTLTVDFVSSPVQGFISQGSSGGRGIGPGITPFGGFAYYPQGNANLVRTDGTPAGSSIVSTTVPWTSDFHWSPMVAFNGELYGTARGASGNELYAYSPFDGGTRLVSDLTPGSGGSYPYRFVPSGDVLYFAARSITGSDTWLCSTDGVTARYVRRMQAVSVSDPGADLLAFDGGVLMRCTYGSGFPVPTTLCRADNDGGSNVVAVLSPPNTNSFPGSFVDFNGLVHFLAFDSMNGFQVWSTDGTDAGTRRVTTGVGFTETPYNTYDERKLLVPFNGGLYFCANDGVVNANKLMTLDPSVDGGARVVFPFDQCSELFADSTRILLRGAFDGGGQQLWASDGTAAGTRMLYARAAERASAGDSIAALGNGVAFSGYAHPLFRAFRTDGFSNTQLSDAGESAFRFTSASAGRVFFAATPNMPTRHQLWVTDGSPGGTRLVTDTFAIPSFAHMVPFTNGVLFEANGTLWRSDGVSSSALVPALNFSGFLERPIGVLGSQALFSGLVGSGTAQLWRTDGIDSGVLVSNDAGRPLSYPRDFVRVGNELYFASSDRPFGNDQLWRSDLSDAGPVLASMAAPMGPGAAFAGRYFFTSFDSDAGSEPWVSDGTDAGTFVFTDLAPGAFSSQPTGWTVSGGTLFFRACARTTGCELYATNGTVGGTRLVLDIYPGPVGSAPRDFVAVNGGVVFVAADPLGGAELWFSDGSAAGTVALTDVYAGVGSSDTSKMTLAGGRLFFLANDGTGRTVWSIDSGVVDAGFDAGTPTDAGTPSDGGAIDGGASTDAGTSDAGVSDAGASDAGASSDGGASDGGASDGGPTSDAGETDAGETDAGETDAGEVDAGAVDAGGIDAGQADAGTSNDAGSMTEADAGANSDAGDPGAVGGGCGCQTVDPTLMVAAIALLALRARKRR